MGFLSKFIPTPILSPQKKVEVLPASELEAISSELLASPFLQKNILNDRFSSTDGFSVIYREKNKVLDHFPSVLPFLGLLDDLPATNLFYLNILVIGNNGCVERHVDHSIRGYGKKLPLPTRVSVLYVKAPSMQGGELVFYNKHLKVSSKIKPVKGLLVHFDGRLRHSVESVSNNAGLRVSLVCEQYCLSASQLESVPEFSIKSTADFFTYLDRMNSESV